MNIAMTEKPLAVRVMDYEGGPGAERATRARYTFGLSQAPDDLWLLCLHLPSTTRILPEDVKHAMSIHDELLDIECAPGELARVVMHVLRWLDTANRQQDEVVADKERESGKAIAARRRRADVLERLTIELEESLGLAATSSDRVESATREEDLPETRLESKPGEPGSAFQP